VERPYIEGNGESKKDYDSAVMLVKSCLFTVTDTNTKLRLSAYSC
jgi:hypothetical protein